VDGSHLHLHSHHFTNQVAWYTLGKGLVIPSN
jgi:hypothetical protein